MLESINFSGFKLLAIRPLGNISSELLKGLQKKCIYRFYNDFVYNLDEYKNVISIEYTSTVPSNLYGENISISAIVGQNGSGKSSLLEIFYYFLFSYSRTEGLLENDPDLPKLENKSFHFEFYYSLENEIYCVEWDNINLLKKIKFSYNIKNQLYERSSDAQSYAEDNDYKIPIYNIVTNYSIYGLNSNSEEDRWLDKLFIKNDGYQTPIVLNPYREEGNINVNREFELANSRLLKVFLSTSLQSEDFNTSHLIKDLWVNQLLFKLNIDKNQKVYINDKYEDIESVINNFETINNYKIKDFFQALFKSLNKKIIYKSLNFSYNKLNLLRQDKLVNDCVDLSNLYIFKKIIKIVFSYKNYKIFKPIFENINIGSLESNSNLITTFSSQYYKYFLADSPNLNQIEIIADSKDNFDLKYDELENIKKALLKYYYKFYDESFINDVYKNLRIKNTNKLSIYEETNNFLKNLNSLLNSKKIRHKYIDILLNKISRDKSHITLKLRQVLNMQENEFFDNLLVSDKKNIASDNDEQIVYYTVKNEYLSKNKNLSIEEIPNAFLEPIFKFTKKDAKIPFELKYLSSGEQQLLHSTISVSYHIDNLLSIIENKEESELRSYNEINIILDEIELYYHPEYQREYINNLITLLSQKKYRSLNFNVIFSTHSPFILSDIPSQNILKLKDGEPQKADEINSFAANIHDLLNDEFFLKKGSMGIFAQNYITEIIKEIDEIGPNVSENEIDTIHSKISIIGEKLIRHGLEDLLIEKTKNVETEIEILKKRITELQSKTNSDEKNQN